MTSGGARARSGPAPDITALRRGRDGAAWTVLPAIGRQGEPPEWPLTPANERELVLWASEWRRPQAVEWERNGQQLEVALYVRAVAIAEDRASSSSDRNLVRQLHETLGISLPGLARNHWVIEGSAPAIEELARQAVTAPAAPRPTGTDGASIKSRLRVVGNG